MTIEERILEDWKRVRFGAYRRIARVLESERPAAKRIGLVFLDYAGVLCNAWFDVEKRRFVSIDVPIATEGVRSAEWLDPGTTYCDEFRYQSIPL